jgi:hypothetical protein
MVRLLVLGATAFALSAGVASAQQAPYGYYRDTAPLYDYAGPASAAPLHAGPHRYGPLIYTPQLYTPTPAFPSPPAEPGYYTAQSVVVPQRFYDYTPGYWAPGNPAAPRVTASVPDRTVRYYGHRMYMMSVNRTEKGSKLTPDNDAKPLSEWLHRP